MSFLRRIVTALGRRRFFQKKIPRRSLAIPGRWCVHGYYTLCPFAPDASGRVLLAGADLSTQTAEVFVLSASGEILHRFGRQPVTPSFWHTGFWQSWSPDARAVYYQSGTLREPCIVRHDLIHGTSERAPGDLEGWPPQGETALFSHHGMLYAAGYGDGQWRPEQSPVPFLARDHHGIFSLGFGPPTQKLVLSTRQILDQHPDKDRIHRAEEELRSRLGPAEGLTLMTYCIRWNPQGTRFLFYFGNHCVVKERREPRLTYVFTADAGLKDIRLALDLSFGRQGVHWGWQPDGENLIGYGPPVGGGRGMHLAEVRRDGTGYRKLSDHASGGHPSVSPVNPDLIVTDEGGRGTGHIVFISRRTGKVVHREPLAKFQGPAEASGRNSTRVCHHPVFNREGTRILCNSLPGAQAIAVVFDLPPKLR